IQARDERHAVHPLPIEGYWPPLFKLDLKVRRLIRRLGGIDRPSEGVCGGLIPRIFQHTRLATATPEIQVATVGAFFRCLDRNAVLLRKLNFLVTAHLPLSDGSDNFQVWCQGLKSNIKPNLVVPFAGAAVRYSFGVMLAGGVDHKLGDKRSPQS